MTKCGHHPSAFRKEYHCTECVKRVKELLLENQRLREKLKPRGYHDVDEFYKD